MSANTNLGSTPVNQGYVQLIHTGETGGISGTLRTLYDGDGTASDLQIASDKVKISTELFIGSKTLTEFVQDTVGAMFSSNTETNITATYQDDDGTIDLVSSGEVTLTGSQTLSNKTLASPTFTGDIDFSDATTPKFTITDTTNSVKTEMRSTDTTGHIGTTTDNQMVVMRNGIGHLTLFGLYTMHNNGGLDLDFRAKDSSGNVVFKVNAGTSKTEISTLLLDSVTISTIQTGSESFADNDTSLMTSAAINDKIGTEVASLVDSAPSSLDTLNELAAALGDDANFSTTVTNNIATKLAKASNLSDLANASTARSNLGVDAAGTDNSTNVTLAGSLDYITLSGQQITRNAIDLTTDVTGTLPVGNGGTGLTSISTLLNSNVTPSSLGLVIGTNVQASNAFLDDISLLTGTGAGGSFVGADHGKYITFDFSSAGFILSSSQPIVTSGNTQDGLLTYHSSSVASVESNLTFDGTDLKLLGDDLEMRWGAGQDFKIYVNSDDAYLVNVREDKDIRFMVNDGNGTSGANITALKIDASENGRVKLPNDNQYLSIGESGDLYFYHDNSNSIIRNATGDLILRNDANDAGIRLQTDDGSGGVTNYITCDGQFTSINLLQSTALPATKKLFFDGGNGTYVHELSDNVIEFRTDNNPQLKIDNSAGVIVNDGSYSSFDFRVESNDNAHMLFVDSGANKIAIGNTTADATLHIGHASSDFSLGGTSGDSVDNLKLESSSANANQLIFSTERVSNGSDWTTTRERIRRRIDVTDMGYIQFGSSFGSNDMVGIGRAGLGTGFIVDGNLKVGIGITSSLAAKLHVVDSDGSNLARFKDSDSSYAGIIIAADTNGGHVGNSGGYAGEGIYFQDSLEVMRFYTAGSEKMRLDSGGRLAIGSTTAQGAKLRLFGVNAGNWNDGLIIDDSSGWAATIYKRDNVPKMFTGLYSGNDNYIWMSSNYSNSGTTITAPRADAVLMARPGTDDLQIYLETHFGNKVGIGTDSPGHKLHVVGDRVTHQNDTGGFYRYNASGAFRAAFTDNNTTTQIFADGDGSNAAMTFNAGNVGIGTNSPSEKLDIRDGELVFTHSSLNQALSGRIRFNEYNGDDEAGAYIQYNGASNYLQMFTNTESTDYEFLRALRGSHLALQPSGGNVGIGTSSPTQDLTIFEDSGDCNVLISSANGASQVFFGDDEDDNIGIIRYDHGSNFMRFTVNTQEAFTITTAGHLQMANDNEIYLQNGGESIAFMGVSDANYRKALYANNEDHYLTNRHTSGDLILMSNNGSAGGETERLRFVAGSGTQNAYFSNVNVGIGTTSPGNKFTINSTSTNQASIQYDSATRLQISVVGSGVSTFLTDNNASCSFTNGVLIGGASASGHDFNFEVLNDHAYVKGPDGWNGNGDKAIVALGSSVSNESFGCGYVYGTGLVLSTYKLSGGGHFGSSTQNSLIIADTTGEASFINDVVAFASSDKRLKENIKPLDNALHKINKINGVEFDWIDGKDKHGNSVHSNTGHDVGVIAQEIEEVLPEVVTTRDNGYKAVKYEKIVPLLIQAIKEQQKQIEELRNG